METPAETSEFEYLLHVPAANASPPATTTAPESSPVRVTPDATAPISATQPPAAVQPTDATGSVSASASTSTAPGTTEQPANSKKRPLEDKKARDRKRVLRNRELARVSNERRKGRIKAMESELTETRQTVSTLEESIRCLEAENKELRNLLQGKPQPPVPPQRAPQ